MNGPHETLPDGLPAGEELLAYLDGELDVDSRRKLEEQLSTSGELRQRLKEYQQAWDLLDDLPRATVDDSFTRTTVQLVAIRAEDEVSAIENSQRTRRGVIWFFGLLSIAAATITGFFLTERHFSEPNNRLIEDLPIIENLGAYRNAGNIEFLRQLDAQKLFQEDAGDAM